MNHVIQSISGASPSLYKNTFESAACKIYWNYSSLDSIFKEVVSDLKITLKTKKYINNLITSLLCKDKDKDLNYAKIIILLVDKNYFIDLKAEHFIPQSTNMDCCYKIGNIIPVVKDIYGDKSVKEKLELYKKNKLDRSLINFLQYNFDEENYEMKINERTEKIADEFCEIFFDLSEKFK